MEISWLMNLDPNVQSLIVSSPNSAKVLIGIGTFDHVPKIPLPTTYYVSTLVLPTKLTTNHKILSERERCNGMFS